MHSKMKRFASGILALLLTSCASKSLPAAHVVLNDPALNHSALYEPPTVHLVPGKVYEFKEGTLTGDGQAFHSHFSYMRALIIGAPVTPEK